MKQKIMLRSRAKTLDPLIRIGKSGITEGILLEIDKMLEKKTLIKIKMLNTSMEKSERKALMDEVLNKTRSELIDSVGFTFVIFRQKDRDRFN